MPEIAEVTVAARQLAHVAVGRTVTALSVLHPRTRRHTTLAALERLEGQRVERVDRHGKWILLRAGSSTLAIHLRMSGQLRTGAGADESMDHRHAVLELGRRSGVAPDVVGVPPPPGVDGTADAATVWFRDPRTFGEWRVIDDAPPTAEDLFDDDVDADLLATRARRRRVGVKAVVLDQARFVAGIGSYLADEALHRAGIDPRRPAGCLHESAWDRILASARDIAVTSAAAGGVTLADEGWVDLWGRPGRFGPELLVHGRDLCASCGEAVSRAVVGGRSARWCPTCQPSGRVR